MNQEDEGQAQPGATPTLRPGSSPLTPHALRHFVVACQFLTVLRLSSRCHEPAPPELAASMAWYPLVGWLLGGGLVLADLALSPWLDPVVVNGLLVTILVALTGGLHQDGLADTLDGLAGGRSPEARLAIMRDPRIGAIGVTGLVLALLLRYAGLLALPEAGRLPVLLAMPAVGRWAMVVGGYGAAYARAGGGLAQPFLAHLTGRQLLIGTVFLALPLVLLLGPLAVAALAVAAALARGMTAWMSGKLGGVTGDTLGATNELAEIVFLLACPALLSL